MVEMFWVLSPNEMLKQLKDEDTAALMAEKFPYMIHFVAYVTTETF